jgi:hypothetical protein
MILRVVVGLGESLVASRSGGLPGRTGVFSGVEGRALGFFLVINK